MTTQGTLLATCDFSPESEEGVVKAAEFARRLDCEVVLLHVIDERAEQKVPEAYLQDLLRAHEMAVKPRLQEVGSRLLGRSVRDVLVEQGDPVETILEVAERFEVELIVAGSRGRGSLGTFLFGSTVTGLLARSKRPVLVVPPAFSRDKPA